VPVLYETGKDGVELTRRTTNLHLLHLGPATASQDDRRGNLIAVFEEMDLLDEDTEQVRRDFQYRTIVALANPDNDVDNQSLYFKSAWSTHARLLFATVVQSSSSCILLEREYEPDLEARQIRTRYRLRRVDSGNLGDADSFFFESDWPGKPVAHYEYKPLALGGRLRSGRSFAVLCERAHVGALVDESVFELVILCVNADTLIVERELILVTRTLQASIPTPYSFEGSVAMTPFSQGINDGWLVIEKSGLTVNGHLVDNACATRRLSPLLPRLIAGGFSPPLSIGKLSVAGGWVRSVTRTPSGRPAARMERNYLLAFEVLQPPSSPRSPSGTFLWSVSFSWSTGRGVISIPNPIRGDQPRVHRRTDGLEDLVEDSSTRCHWLCLDRTREATRLSRLGHDGTAHYRDLIGQASGHDGIRVAFNFDDDETALCWLDNNGPQNRVSTLHRARPLSLHPIVAPGTECPDIGPLVVSENDLLGTDLRPNSPIAGHRYFAVSLSGAPPNVPVTLWISKRRDSRLADRDSCTFQIDTSDPESVSFNAQTDANGRARVEIPLDDQALSAVFSRPPGFSRSNSEISRWHSPLLAQWLWALPRIVQLDLSGDQDWWGDDRPVGQIIERLLHGSSKALIIPIGSL